MTVPLTSGYKELLEERPRRTEGTTAHLPFPALGTIQRGSPEILRYLGSQASYYERLPAVRPGNCPVNRHHARQ